MISSLFMLNPSGEVLIEKQFREKIPRTSLEDYWATYISPSITGAATVVQYSRYAFIHVVKDDTVLLGITTHEVSPMLVIEILNMIATTLKTYLKSLSEDTLKENFSLVYQLLEELIDNGYPLTTEYHVLEELVPRNNLENRIRSLLDKPKKSKLNEHFPTVSWRSPAIKYSANELYFDVTEFMDVVINAEGAVVRASVRGVIDCISHLSGMPDVSMHLQNTEMFEDVAYHRCVRHARYEADRVINFIPPDGPFSLFQYRCKPLVGLMPPFYVNPQLTFHNTTGRLNCMVGLRSGPQALEKGKEVHKVIIHIPCPPNTEAVTVSACSQGSHKFNNSTKILTWTVGTLSKSSPSLSGELLLAHDYSSDNNNNNNNDNNTTTSNNNTSHNKNNNNNNVLVEGTGEPVSVEFQIPNYSLSGIKVDSVSVTNESYKPYKGVKYITKAGRFTVRTV